MYKLPHYSTNSVLNLRSIDLKLGHRFMIDVVVSLTDRFMIVLVVSLKLDQ